MIRFLKPFSFLPALCLMYMIYSFSAQDSTQSSALSFDVSYHLVKAADLVLNKNLEEWQIRDYAERYNGPIRKLAHMSEYFALAIAVSFPLYVYHLRGICLVFVAGFFCVGFAGLDEYHQSFVSGRAPSVRDVLIDSTGVFLGIILTRIVSWIGRKTLFYSPSHKRRKKAAVSYLVSSYDTAQYDTAQYDTADYEDVPRYPAQTHQRHLAEDGFSSSHSAPPRPEEPLSDRLSEDMSLKKLVSDLRHQKKKK